MTKQTTSQKTNTNPEFALPAGKIKFAALTTPRPGMGKQANTLLYSAKVEIDGSGPSAEKYRKLLKSINTKLVVTENNQGESVVEKDGNYQVTAKSKNKPHVYDSKMNLIPSDLVPMIDTGVAILLVQPFDGTTGLGGGIELKGIQLLEFTEFAGSVQEDPETTRAKLIAAKEQSK